MKGKLIKTDVNYILEDDKGVVVASTSLKKEGLSLSLKNCQSIELGYDLDDKISEHLEKNHIEASTKRVQVIKELILEILGDKKFSEEDIEKAIEFGHKTYHSWKDRNEEKFIQSLQQTEWDVEVVMEPCFYDDSLGGFSTSYKPGMPTEQPKLDSNNCLILRKI